MGAMAALTVVVGGGAIWIIRRRRFDIERQIRRTIAAISTEMLRDVVIPDGTGGQIHLDFLLLTRNGLLVLDLKDVPGSIFGSNRMEEWTVIDGSHRFTFPNPQGALYDRVAAVKALAQDVPVDGRVVFSPRGEFAKGIPDKVTTLPELAETYHKPSREETRAVMDAFYPHWEKVRRAATPA